MTRPLAPLLLAALLALPGAAESPPAAPGRALDLDLSRPISSADVARFNAGSGLARREVLRTGLCGAMTRAGRPCRNKVRGGGPCWRHR